MSRNTEHNKSNSEFVEKLVSVNRVAKVVQGGKRFSFAALVVVGDGKGRVGKGSGKAREVPDAIRKATEQAKKNLIRVPMKEGRTLHHDVIGRYGAGKIIIRSAPPGTGVIAGGPARAVLEVSGLQDVVSKSIRSSNPYNIVGAIFSAFESIESPKFVASKRGKQVNQILPKKQALVKSYTG